MKTELRKQLGKAVYEAENKNRLFQRWDSLDPFGKEHYCLYGEAAVSSFVSMIMPGVNNFLDTINPMLTEEKRKQLMDAVDIIKLTVGE